MKKGKIIARNTDERYAHTKGNFSIDFDHSSFGPYNYLFQRETLYYSNETQERGSYFFPIKNVGFKNTEIFLETNDIVIGVGERGSFSGKEKVFIEIINLKTQQKHRLYPDELGLIYNSKTSIIVYYKKGEVYKKLELNFDTLEKISEKSVKLDAFFKLLFNYKTGDFVQLIYYPNSRSHTAGYFEEKVIPKKNISWHNLAYLKISHSPKNFERKKFLLTTDTSKEIDVWEVSLTGKI